MLNMWLLIPMRLRAERALDPHVMILNTDTFTTARRWFRRARTISRRITRE
jgi:hypothetical protein